MKKGKKYVEASKLVEKSKLYTKEEAAKFNVNYVAYEETGRDQSLGNTTLKYNQESSSIRK